jgi:hypothetical protein
MTVALDLFKQSMSAALGEKSLAHAVQEARGAQFDSKKDQTKTFEIESSHNFNRTPKRPGS